MVAKKRGRPPKKAPELVSAQRPMATWAAIDIIDALIQNNGDVNTRTLEKQATPLVYAARMGETEIVRLLLQRLGDESAGDSDGVTALDFAKAGGFDDIVELLTR